MPLAKNVKELKKQLSIWKQKQFPDRPPHTLSVKPLPWKAGKDAENLIRRHCNMLAWYGVPISASIIDVNGTWIPGVGFAPNNSTKGVADVHLTYEGKTHWVEIKYKGDTQKDDQKDFQKEQESAGATYTIVKTPSDWFSLLAKIVNNEL
jgi:hypothetical protein